MSAFETFFGVVGNSLASLYRIATPGPTTPLFQEGGLLHYLNEDVSQIVGCMAVFALFDALLIKPFIVPKARYFALHVLCNAWVCLLAAPHVLAVLSMDAREAFRGPGHIITNNIIAALHLYHCLAFSLNADDIFHHLTFCATLCSLAIPNKLYSGLSIPFGAFFLSGLPGGIDYLMLTLSAHGIVSKDLQKDVYVKLNVWMRGPAMTVYMFIWWQTYINGGHPIPIAINIVACPLHFYNGQFYAQQAVESNAIYRYKKHLEAMGVVVPNIKFSDLHSKPTSSNSAGGKKADKKTICVAPISTTSVGGDCSKASRRSDSEGSSSAPPSPYVDYGDSSVTSPQSGASVPFANSPGQRRMPPLSLGKRL